MILYNVTVSVEESIHEEWLQWMKNVHIPEVLSTGLFNGHRVLNLLGDYNTGGVTYCVQYFLDNMDKYKEYEQNHAPSLQASHLARYSDRAVSFRTLLQDV
jgi:hypothetical protein